MNRKLIITDDGSHSIQVEELGENYHSSFGAITESRHIYIKTGFKVFCKRSNVNVLEIGMGTGLNVLLTLYESGKNNQKVYYHALEAFPLEPSFYEKLNFESFLEYPEKVGNLNKIHSIPAGKSHMLNDNFEIFKDYVRLENAILPNEKFDVVYYDAFGPEAQPEMWNIPVLEKVCNAMKYGGILVTFSVKGLVKRNLRNLGFSVETLPGPPGKRHILCAWKDSI